MYPFIIDGHLDLAYNALTYGRDYFNGHARTRMLESDAPYLKHTGECTVGFPDLLRGRVGLVFGTIFCEPKSHRISGDYPAYANAQEAHAMGMAQLDWYRRITEDDPRLALVTDQSALRELLQPWAADGTAFGGLTHGPHPKSQRAAERKQIGIVLLMEGADPISEPKELERWYEKGLRIVGPAWDTTRYAGGTWQKGRLPKLGRELFEVMASFDVVLDVAHMSHETLLESLDVFPGKHVIASHCNPARFVPNVAERHLPDQAIERIVERGGVIGTVLYNKFLKKDWSGSKRDVSLDDVVRMIDHICQIAGNAEHAAIGSDYDGGLGYNEIPRELNSVRDHARIAAELQQRGYSAADVARIMHGNWLRVLQNALPG
jgi:membrane dipeptidase